MNPVIQPIGFVKSPVVEPKDNDWGSVVSEIHLEERFAPGLTGLDEFSHVIVVFLIHQASFDPAIDLVRHPRGREDVSQVGIFAQRGRHRPAPIGITAVQLLAIEDNIATVKGLDAIDGTPVLDLKPYFPAFDRVDDPVVPDWVEKLMADYF